jgi:hypothetical protein
LLFIIKREALKSVQFCSSSRKAIILTTGIHLVFRGLKFESDAEIGQKGALCEALKESLLIWGRNGFDGDKEA